MVCAVLLVWKVVYNCCRKNVFTNNSCGALAEVVQILNVFCLVVSLRKGTVIYCVLCMCLLSQIIYHIECSNCLSSSDILEFNWLCFFFFLPQ